jgi:hypothetical protein
MKITGAATEVLRNSGQPPTNRCDVSVKGHVRDAGKQEWVTDQPGKLFADDGGLPPASQWEWWCGPPSTSSAGPGGGGQRGDRGPFGLAYRPADRVPARRPRLRPCSVSQPRALVLLPCWLHRLDRYRCDLKKITGWPQVITKRWRRPSRAPRCEISARPVYSGRWRRPAICGSPARPLGAAGVAVSQCCMASPLR